MEEHRKIMKSMNIMNYNIERRKINLGNLYQQII